MSYLSPRLLESNVYCKVYTFKCLFGLFVTVLFLEGDVALVQTKGGQWNCYYL
jgi:hypothetical protein